MTNDNDMIDDGDPFGSETPGQPLDGLGSDVPRPSTDLVRELGRLFRLSDRDSIEVQVHDGLGSGGSADPDTGTIYIGSQAGINPIALSRGDVDPGPVDTTDMPRLLGVANIVSHEVEHLNQSDLSHKEAMADRFGVDTPEGRLAGAVWNVFEDVYIDHKRSDRYPGLGDHNVERIREVFADDEVHPPVDEVPDHIAAWELTQQLAVPYPDSLKGDLGECPDGFTDYAVATENRLRELLDTHHPDDRFELIAEQAEALLELVDLPPQPDQSDGGDGDETDETDGDEPDESGEPDEDDADDADDIDDETGERLQPGDGVPDDMDELRTEVAEHAESRFDGEEVPATVRQDGEDEDGGDESNDGNDGWFTATDRSTIAAGPDDHGRDDRRAVAGDDSLDVPDELEHDREMVDEIRRHFEELKSRKAAVAVERGPTIERANIVAHMAGDHTEQRVFERTKPQLTGDRAVGVVLDLSGSMNDEIEVEDRTTTGLIEAKRALWALGTAIEEIGDSFVCGGFHTINARGSSEYQRDTPTFVGPDEPVTWNAIDAIEASGDGPMAAGISHTSDLLRQTPARERFMVVLSDGNPYYFESGTLWSSRPIQRAKATINEQRSHGIHVMGIGFGELRDRRADDIFGAADMGWINGQSADLPRNLVDAYKRVLPRQ